MIQIQLIALLVVAFVIVVSVPISIVTSVLCFLYMEKKRHKMTEKVVPAQEQSLPIEIKPITPKRSERERKEDDSKPLSKKNEHPNSDSSVSWQEFGPQEGINGQQRVQEGPNKPSHSLSNDTEVTQLAISEGQLIPATLGKTAYYCSWVFEGRIYYRLNCDEGLIGKAINNHSSVIDPFCDKTEDSIDYSIATNVVTEEDGMLDTENNIKKKAIIKYI